MMVNWLYGITKENFLPELSDILFKQSFAWSKWFGERNLLMDAALHVDDKNIMRRHSVNVAMGLKDPAKFKINTKPFPKTFTWNQANAPIEIIAEGKKLPSWKLSEDGILYHPMGERSGLYQGLSEKISKKIILIPYGFTKLRIVAFPVVK